jgi:hypothetical protein
VILGLMTAWDRRRRGTFPSGRPPREFDRAILRLVLEATVVGGLAWLAGEQVGGWPAAAVAGVGSWAVVSRYEHAYAAIAARCRERPRRRSPPQPSTASTPSSTHPNGWPSWRSSPLSTSSDFGLLRQHLGVSDSDLSKQAAALEAAGYLTITKRGRGRGAVTAYRATKTGRRVYQQHRAALRGLLGD